MSLSEILDEIGGDLTDGIDLPSITDIKNSKTKPTTKKQSLFEKDLPSIDKVTLENLHRKYSLIELHEVVKNDDKIDKGIVLEAMAALPHFDRVVEAKLTTAPSAINKRILDDIIYEDTDKVPESWISCIEELYNEVGNRLPMLEKLITEIHGKKEIIAELVNSKGLLEKTIDFGNSSYIESWHKAWKTFDIFKVLLNNCYISTNIDGKCLLDLMDELTIFYKGCMRTINDFIESADIYLKTDREKLTTELNNVLKTVEHCYDSMEALNKISELVSGEDCLFAFIINDIKSM